MTLTADQRSSSTTAPGDTKDAGRVIKPVRTRRSGIWLFAAIALVLLGGLVGYVLYQQAGNATKVYVAQDNIERGQTIEKGDLATIDIAAGQTTAAIPVSEVDKILGTVATVDIPAGGLITKSSTASSLTVPEGKALVGLTLQPGRLPAQALTAGDNVVLVPVPVQGVAEVEVTADQTIPAVVSQVRPIPNSNDVVVDIYVSTQAAANVTSKGAAGTLALYLAPGEK